MTRNEQVKFASDFGRTSYLKGVPCSPFQDKMLKKLLKGRTPGDDPPEGEASTPAILAAWQHGWQIEMLADVG